MVTQVRIMNILDLNRGGMSVSLHNKLSSYSGRCTRVAHQAANSDMQIILN